MHEGHRKRMIERLEKSEESLQDHELIEILLFNAIPRKNTNEIAHELLNRFGSIYDLLHADISQLKTIGGIGENTAAYLRLFGLIHDKFGVLVPSIPKAYSPREFSDTLFERYKTCTAEILEIFCFDENGRIFDCRRFTSGHSDRVLLNATSTIEYIAGKKPRSVIIAHTHPDGDPTPSQADDRFTFHLAFVCSIQKIDLLDHMIISPGSYYSYFRAGKLDDYKKKPEERL